MMELPIGAQGTDGQNWLRATVPLRVIIAFDQLTASEQEAVLQALRTLARNGLPGAADQLGIQRLTGSDPLYSFRAAPEVQVIVRAEPETAVEVVDIVRPAALRNFAHAGS